MNVTKSSIAIAIAILLLASPVAMSTWSSAGNIEPSTSYDTPAWMFQDPPPVGANRIYLNAVANYAPQGLIYISPNVAALSTQIEVPNSEYHYAVFGVWKDCNGDGYIGMAEQALREYDSALLLDQSVCPAATGTANSWTAGAHNYNGWVSEYVPIANDPASADKRVYVDNDAMVWGDYGRPDQAAFFRSCALFPQPRGTYQSTGGFLNWVECRTQQNGFDTYGSFNAAMDAIGDPLSLRGEDGAEFDWRTTGLEMPTFGSEDTQYTPATVWDCDAAPLVHVGDTYNSTPLNEMVPLGGDQSSQKIFAISPGLSNSDPTTWTVPALVNHTREGAEDCDTSNDDGHDFYGTQAGFVGETDFNGVSPKNKHESDWNLGFATASRGVVPLGPALQGGSSGAPGTDGGLSWATYSVDGSGWFSPSVYASKLGFRTVKVDLASQTVDLSGAWWLTFYAYAGPATAARGLQMPGGIGAYGSAQCGENDSGIHNGWNCDVTTWNTNPDGTPLPEPYPLARPGQEYNFLDVDCYDGRIGDTGVAIQPAFYGPGPCS